MDGVRHLRFHLRFHLLGWDSLVSKVSLTMLYNSQICYIIHKLLLYNSQCYIIHKILRSFNPISNGLWTKENIPTCPLQILIPKRSTLEI